MGSWLCTNLLCDSEQTLCFAGPWPPKCAVIAPDTPPRAVSAWMVEVSAHTNLEQTWDQMSDLRRTSCVPQGQGQGQGQNA